MNNRSIVASIASSQQEVADTIMESLVYCPMCDDTHANNTWCQLPGGIVSTGGAQ